MPVSRDRARFVAPGQRDAVAAHIAGRQAHQHDFLAACALGAPPLGKHQPAAGWLDDPVIAAGQARQEPQVRLIDLVLVGQPDCRHLVSHGRLQTMFGGNLAHDVGQQRALGPRSALLSLQSSHATA